MSHISRSYRSLTLTEHPNCMKRFNYLFIFFYSLTADVWRITNHTTRHVNVPVWTSSVFSVRLSHSQRAAGQRQQETNCRQAHFTLNAWMTLQAQLRSGALGLGDEMGRKVAVICTIKSTCFSSELRLKMFLADIQRARASCCLFLFTTGEQPLEDTLLDSETGVINVTSLAPSAAASDCLLP